MQTREIIYHQDGQEFKGFLAFDSAQKKPRPCVMVAHDWTGRNEFACEKAKMLANLGYVGFALDMFGQGRLGQTVEEKMALIHPLMEDRPLLLSRIKAAFDTASALEEVAADRLAAIGFCFGGLCVLDLARSGAPLRGVVSFHGLLNAPSTMPKTSIKAKVLALHGYDDPMVKPDVLAQFCQEMTKAEADWQVHQYGHTQHAFTNPLAHDLDMGTIYNALAEKRSLQAMRDFLEEIFSG